MYHTRRRLSKVRVHLGVTAVTAVLAGLAWAVPAPLAAQVTIEITPPRLEDGLTEIEAIVTAEIRLAATEVSDFVNAALDKPDIMRAFADATAGAAPIYPMPRPGGRSGFEISIGTTAAVATESLNPTTVARRVDEFEEEDDIYLGAGVNPLLISLNAPAERLLSGLRVHAAGGYLSTDAAEVMVTGFGLSTWAGYPIVSRRVLGRYVAFSGVDAAAGIAYLRNALTVEIEPGLVTQEFTIDPDGAGPIFAQDVTVEIDPHVDAELETTVFTFGAGAATGVNLLDTFGLSVGVFGEIIAGRTVLDLSSDDAIELTGYLSDLVAEGGDARLVTSGGTEPVAATPFRLSVVAALLWRVEPYLVTIPLSWRSTGGVSAGIFFGVTL